MRVIASLKRYGNKCEFNSFILISALYYYLLLVTVEIIVSRIIYKSFLRRLIICIYVYTFRQRYTHTYMQIVFLYYHNIRANCKN